MFDIKVELDIMWYIVKSYDACPESKSTHFFKLKRQFLKI